MKAILTLSFISSVLAAAAAPSGRCNADNCARAVTGTRAGLASSRASDCNSFLSCTLSPPTSSATLTTTVTLASPIATQTQIIVTPISTATGVPATAFTTGTAIAAGKRDEAAMMEKRSLTTRSAQSIATICPTAVPNYASQACAPLASRNVLARYSSACLCGGATPTSSLALAPVVSTIITETYTSPTATPTPGVCILIAYFGKGQGACGCDYTTVCGKASCGLSERASGSGYNMDTCRDACDARADCQAFSVSREEDGGVCTLCFSPRTSETNPYFWNGYRDTSGNCSNPACNPSANA